jgi:hypothetical protein
LAYNLIVLGLVKDRSANQVWSLVMVEQLSETMPEDVRQAFSEAVRLYSHWQVEAPDTPAPTLGLRRLNVSLSGICDLVAAYKNEPLPLPVHDELWTLIDDMKLKAELAIDPSYATGGRCLDALIQDRRKASDRGGADTSRATLAPNDKPEL